MLKKITLLAALLTIGFCSNLRAEETNASTTTITNAAAVAPTDAAKKADPDVQQRLADLEAYVSNGARGSDAPDAKVSSKLDGVAGPGHNAWMLTSAALVLFMTLPGLALFYGGLVRRKNILSVMAQCLGCAGLVTILWWSVGYSFAFASGSAWLGVTRFAFLRGVG